MIRRKLYNNETIASIGIVLSVFCVISTLVNLIIEIVIKSLNGGGSIGTSTLLNYLINVCFYLMICNYFIKGKSNFGYVYWAICMLLISSYVLPAIFDVIESIARKSFNFRGMSFYLIYSGMLLGILYFIFLCLNNKQRENGYIIVLIVLGTIMFVLGIFSFTYTVISSVKSIIATVNGVGLNNLTAFWSIVSFIIIILEALASTGFSIVYFLYPINIKSFY